MPRESRRQVCYYPRDVLGLECNLKGCNETLSINILTAPNKVALKSKGSPILMKSLCSLDPKDKIQVMHKQKK